MSPATESLVAKIAFYLVLTALAFPFAFVVQYAWNANLVGLFGAPPLEYGNAFWLTWLATLVGRNVTVQRHG